MTDRIKGLLLLAPIPKREWYQTNMPRGYAASLRYTLCPVD